MQIQNPIVGVLQEKKTEDIKFSLQVYLTISWTVYKFQNYVVYNYPFQSSRHTTKFVENFLEFLGMIPTWLYFLLA